MSLTYADPGFYVLALLYVYAALLVACLASPSARASFRAHTRRWLLGGLLLWGLALYASDSNKPQPPAPTPETYYWTRPLFRMSRAFLDRLYGLFPIDSDTTGDPSDEP